MSTDVTVQTVKTLYKFYSETFVICSSAVSAHFFSAFCSSCQFCSWFFHPHTYLNFAIYFQETIFPISRFLTPIKIRYSKFSLCKFRLLIFFSLSFANCFGAISWFYIYIQVTKLYFSDIFWSSVTVAGSQPSNPLEFSEQWEFSVSVCVNEGEICISPKGGGLVAI